MKLIIDITAEEIEYARRVNLYNILELSMTDPDITYIDASSKAVVFTNRNICIAGYPLLKTVRVPTTLRTFLHRYHKNTPVHPIRVEINYK